MNIIILGNGGHSRVIQDIIHTKKEYNIIGILDDKYELATKENGIVFAPLAYLHNIMTPGTKIIVAIGNNITRKIISDRLNIRREQYLTIVHPSAVVSPTVKIGYGTVVMPGAYINAGATIGGHCIINTGAIVEHDSNVGDYAHISPNATLTADVSVGEGVHIGASTTVIPGIEIGSWSIIGAGSSVIRQIPPFSTAVGCPTRIVSKQGKENIEIRL